MFRTEITRMLDIKHPILQAPMAGGPTTPDLVAAVSNAGGLGSLGAGYLTPDQIRSAIRARSPNLRRHSRIEFKYCWKRASLYVVSPSAYRH